MFVRESIEVGGTKLSIETGRMAKQADGAVVLTYGDTVVLVTAVSDKNPRDLPFLPLTVEYTERMYAAGRIPGSYFRREGRPSAQEILSCRLIDRPIRPLFPDGYRCETQIIAMVLSSDKENPADVLAMTGASAALHISDIAWAGPLAAVRVGRVDGELIANPTKAQQEAGDLNIVVAASFDALVMVEGTTQFVSEEDVVEALVFAQDQARPILELQEKLRAAVGKEKRTYEAPQLDEGLVARVGEMCHDRLVEAVAVREKHARYAAIDAVKKAVIEELGEEFAERTEEVKEAYGEVKRRYIRNMVVRDKIRLDGRQLDEIRTITSEASVLPRTHGSALFTRGETQTLATATLATQRSDQRIESVMGDYNKAFLLHYNFPPFSTGEAKRFGPPGRREIGHGNLAERSIQQVLPKQPDDFPYVLRVVSEVLESNGSSSMASVCGGSLALMDAGVPIKAPVAGIAMGLIHEDGQFRVLSDILGDEDHLGDMDFKVTGTREGICAIQMDIKLESVPREVLAQALEQARQGRLHILDKMAECLAAPREELSPNAPRIMNVKIKVDRIRDIIGPGGKTIRAIQDETGAEINVADDGTVTIAAIDGYAAKKAVDLIEGLTAEAEIGASYRGRVRRITDFGAFVEILPGTDGLVHISEMDHKRIAKVEDVCAEGDEMVVKVINIDREGKIRLSRKEAFDVEPNDVRQML
ncbi:MAG: polyribonucleotide nucleotidyltransferase [Proteobacteria bacterium]|nr:MAG: polyribonucleotide nucleotidyltransferase [Pseudomonadota bacterium]PIE18894.1 MAG: polyribonucleotide nucleotidyltransferase [Pseudomonadota bacterium]